jgi:hypothetical protein
MTLFGGHEYTFYFAWTPSGTPWDVSLARMDETIFSLEIDHDEGQIPQAVIEIRNPRRGMLGGLVWAWISFSVDACGPFPLFFGRLVGVPEKMLFNTLKVKLIARAPDYMYQKQQVARSLKTAPNYDALFFDVLKRDDPDAILEGWSALYHSDRVNLRVSASDILVGEDGTVLFADEDVFHDSVDLTTLQSPLVAVNVKAEVTWQQQYRGSFDVGKWAYPTLGGEAFVGDWPKSGTSLGGGYYAGIAWAGERDPDPATAALLSLAPQVTSISYQWTNTQRTHTTGDTMSVSLNYTPPWGTAIVLRELDEFAIINPDAVDYLGNPDPINKPAKITIDWFCYKTYDLNFLGKQALATLSLVYVADRKRTERLEMTVKADVQPFLIDPQVVEDTEQITLKSGDLSVPETTLLNWDEVGMGGFVEQGIIVFPDNPLVPGQTSSQVSLNSGNTGMVIPTFSNIAGQTTQDGTVTWVSMGDTPPQDGAGDWVRDANVALGTIICPKPISGIPNFNSVLAPGQLQHPPQGVAVPRFAMYCTNYGGPGDGIRECISPGIVGGSFGTGGGGGQFQAQFTFFSNPTGAYLYICVRAGRTSLYHHSWNQALHGQTADGSAVWQNIGFANVPVGGWPGMTPAATFFPTARGQQLTRNMLCRARAKLRKRARAAEVSFEARFEAVSQVSCRMNAGINDIRLPGGKASGKVVSYKLMVDGDAGKVIGKVTLGCSIGNNQLGALSVATAIATDPGIPTYVGVAGTPNGYVQAGYQQYESVNTLLTPGDPNYVAPGTAPSQGVGFAPLPVPPAWPHEPPTVLPLGCTNSLWTPGPEDLQGNTVGYTPPVGYPNDDGITFPAFGAALILQNQWHGVASTMNPANIKSYQLQLDQVVHDAVAQANTTKTVSVGAGGIETTTVPIVPTYDIQVAVQQAVLKNELFGTGLWYELVLKPLNNGPFANSYVVSTVPLQLPKTIDLAAPG